MPAILFGPTGGDIRYFQRHRPSGEIPVNAIFTAQDLPDYRTSLSTQCEQCRAHQKIDAIVNSYGYSKI